VNDRPLAPILAALAAVMFVAAFSAAAVLRPDSAADPTAAAARTAPATAQENASLATLVSPSLSRVAALPALHLPKARKPAKKKSKPPTKPATTAPSVTVAPPAATAAPPVSRPVAPAPAPPRPKSNVGKTFDSEG
jgi:hypothetical protein